MKKSILFFTTLLLLAFAFQSCEECKEPLPYCAKVTKVVVTQFPTTNGPIPWDDNGTQTDLFIRFWDMSSEVGGEPVKIYEFASFIQNAQPTEPHTFDLSDTDLCLSPTTTYRLSLYDEDDDANPKTDVQIIEGINFTPYDVDGSEFPNPIILAKDGTTIEVHVEYLK